MITTIHHLSEFIKSLGIKNYSVSECIRHPYITVNFYKVKWFDFVLKNKIKRCKKNIDFQKPLLMQIEYKLYTFGQEVVLSSLATGKNLSRFGYLVDVKRRLFESDDSYRKRILKNHGG